MAWMFLNDEGMRGGTAHAHIAGSRLSAKQGPHPFIGSSRSARNSPDCFRWTRGGAPIAGDLYDVPLNKLQQVLSAEPQQAELSIVTRSDGQPSLGMVVRAGQEINLAIAIAMSHVGAARLGFRGGLHRTQGGAHVGPQPVPPGSDDLSGLVRRLRGGCPEVAGAGSVGEALPDPAAAAGERVDPVPPR